MTDGGKEDGREKAGHKEHRAAESVHKSKKLNDYIVTAVYQRMEREGQADGEGPGQKTGEV